MARRRRTRQILSAASELRKGFTLPNHAKIKTALRNKSKEFIIRLFLSAYSMLPKSKKLKLLVKIERGITKRVRRRRSKSRRRAKTRRRKTRRKARRRRTRTRKRARKAGRKRKKAQFVKGSAAAKAWGRKMARLRKRRR